MQIHCPPSVVVNAQWHCDNLQSVSRPVVTSSKVSKQVGEWCGSFVIAAVIGNRPVSNSNIHLMHDAQDVLVHLAKALEQVVATLLCI